MTRAALTLFRAALTFSRAALSPFRTALSLFTVLPVGGPAEIDPQAVSRIVVWLPVAGALVATLAAGAMLAIETGGHGVARRLLAATIAVALLAALTGGLHLDGLADTADGLYGHRPKDQALYVMRKSDIGPMGVLAVLFVVLVQVFALATVPAQGWLSALALIAAVTTGRVAAVLATGLPPARPEGFGALIAGTTSPRTRLAVALVFCAIVVIVGTAVGGLPLAAKGIAGVAAGLVATTLVLRTVTRRLGGTTGDVFGALIEVATSAAILTFALI